MPEGPPQTSRTPGSAAAGTADGDGTAGLLAVASSRRPLKGLPGSPWVAISLKRLGCNDESSITVLTDSAAPYRSNVPSVVLTTLTLTRCASPQVRLLGQLTSITLESVKPGMRSSLQITPASSSWEQSLLPQPRDWHSAMLFSRPPQLTLSSQMRPAE